MFRRPEKDNSPSSELPEGRETPINSAAFSMIFLELFQEDEETIFIRQFSLFRLRVPELARIRHLENTKSVHLGPLILVHSFRAGLRAWQLKSSWPKTSHTILGGFIITKKISGMVPSLSRVHYTHSIHRKWWRLHERGRNIIYWGVWRTSIIARVNGTS